MGYACPVCDRPQHDAEHLANHLAMTALTHGDAHEDWLDETVPGWSEESPETLGDRVVPHAETVPHETVFEDTTEGHDHAHGDAPAGTPPAPGAEAVQAAVEEARRMRTEAADDEGESTEDES
ncbi:MAG: DUF5810 domain-containing protein [Haloferacaceae archaeon]